MGNAHVHCQCTLCVGKAVYPMTAWRHIQRERLAFGEDQPADDRDIILNNEENEERLSINSDGGSDLHDNNENLHNLDEHDNQQDADNGCDSSSDDNGRDPIGGDDNFEPSDDDDPDPDEDDDIDELDREEAIKQFVLDAVLRLVEIKGEAGFSLKTLEDLLIWGRN